MVHRKHQTLCREFVECLVLVVSMCTLSKMVKLKENNDTNVNLVGFSLPALHRVDALLGSVR